MKTNEIKIGDKIQTLSGTATVVELHPTFGSVKIKHDRPAGNGQEEWMNPGQMRKAGE
jgi:hypothetical protein